MYKITRIYVRSLRGRYCRTRKVKVSAESAGKRRPEHSVRMLDIYL